MEDLLRTLLDEGSEGQKAAMEWQRQGKKVIGILYPSYVPEEIIHAAGMLPWRVRGTRSPDTSHATTYRPPTLASYGTHIIEAFMSGEIKFPDGIIGFNVDDDNRRVYDVLVHIDTEKSHFHHILDGPRNITPLRLEEFVRRISNFVEDFEHFFQVKITHSSLKKAIRTLNKTRSLLKKVYEMRRTSTILCGAETLRVASAATSMPKEQFNNILGNLLDYLPKRTGAIPSGPRILLISETLDNMEYVDLIEDSGALVAMDALDIGSRYCWFTVDEKEAETDPILALAKYYLLKPTYPRSFWRREVERVLEWVRQYNVKGILALTDTYGYVGLYFNSFLKRQAEQAGVPMLDISREYIMANRGQLQTRMQAFFEIISEGRYHQV